MIWVSVLIVLALIGLEALFVASEMALVSLREGQLRALTAGAGARARHLQRLMADPNRFLGAVQLGVTLTALGSSAYGEVTLAHATVTGLRDLGTPGWAAEVVGFGGPFLAITYLTIVVGELVPKRIALQRAERTAVVMSPSLHRFAVLTRPALALLSASTNALVRLLGADPGVARERITEEELRDLVTAHESLSRDERSLIDEVFAAGERQVREVMVPRTEVEFLDASYTVARAAKLVAPLTHSRFPVVRGSHDDVVGFVHVRDLLTPPVAARRGTRLADIAREVPLLPATKRVLPALSEMRREGHHLAVVVDEYGGTAGIVTLEDLIEELVGEIRDEYDVDELQARRLRGGDVEIDGLLNRDEFAEQAGVELPEGPFETVAGYVMATLGRLAKVGDTVELPGARLRVTEMDGRRVDRVRVSLAGSGAGESEG